MNRLRVENGELEKGIAALKAGRRKLARRLLAQSLCARPDNAAAWLWLSRCIDDETRRQECLERALRLEPDNEVVLGALGQGRGALLREIVGAGASGDQALHSVATPLEVEPLQPAPPDNPEWRSRIEEPEPGQESLPPAVEGRNPVAGWANGWRRHLVLTASVVAALLLVSALLSQIGRPVSEAQSTGGELLGASGIIQAEDVQIASERGGRVATLLVNQGDRVAAGEPVLQLDTTQIDAQIEAAQAAVALAKAGLAQAKAGARPGQIVIAQAQLAQAQAAQIAAMRAVSDTMALVENPQDIRLQIAVAQAQAEAARHQVARAMHIKEGAEIAKEKFESVESGWAGGGRRKILVDSGPISELKSQLPEEYQPFFPDDPPDGVYNYGDMEIHVHGDTYDLYMWVSPHIPFELHLAPNSWWQAWVGVNAALAQQKGIEDSLAHLYAQRANPQSLEARVDEALAALAQAEAGVGSAQAQVDALQAGASAKEIAALEARVAQARAALDSLLTERSMLEILSPLDGIVLDVVIHPGEIAAPGAALLTVAELDEVLLTVYLPETQIGGIQVGQGVQVMVDSFPGRIFEGKVTHIANHVEFTPRNVATKEERVNLVLAVEVRIANDDGALKPGMPADAFFGG